MNAKKFLVAVLAGFVGNVIAFFLLEELLFKSYMQKAVYQPIGASVGVSLSPLIGVLAMILIMAYIYPKGYEGGTPAIEGLRFGILMGLFLGIPLSVFLDAMFSITLGPVLILILVTTLEIAASGMLIGLVYGRMKKAVD